MLQGSEDALWDAYDVAMLDLDGVVYIGPDAVPGAPDHLAAAREGRDAPGLRHQQRLPDRRPRSRAHLRDLGIEVDDGDVVTSAQAAARLLAEQLPAGSAVFVIGGEGLEVALAEHGPARRCRTRAERAGRRGVRLPRRPALVDGDRRRDPGPRRAAVGGLEHRPDRADPDGSRTGQRRAGRASWPGSPTASRWSPGKPRAAAVRGDAAPGRRRAAAGGGGPAGHRHRGRQRTRATTRCW